MPKQKGGAAKGCYKRPESPYYQYDFKIRGVRFSGSTRKKTEREAKAFVAAEKTRRRAEIESAGTGPDMSINVAAARYYEERAKFLSDAAQIDTNLARIVEFFGPETSLAAAANGKADKNLAELVARRRAETVGEKTNRPISNATVNRSVIDCFTRFVNYARRAWHLEDAIRKPEFGHLRLPETKERIRELSDDQVDALYKAIRPDYMPIMVFSHVTGVRLSNALTLTWRQVDFSEATMRIKVKDPESEARWVTLDLTDMALAVLRNERGKNETNVFTYKVQRGRHKGDRRPITKSGLRRAWEAARDKVGLGDFHWHDFRHDFASKLLRYSGDANLKTVQQALTHKTIDATKRYAHVTRDDVARAMKDAERIRYRKTRKNPAIRLLKSK